MIWAGVFYIQPENFEKKENLYSISLNKMEFRKQKAG